ncbi:MAG: hypothetical protein ACYC6Q_13155 [Syntrophales bacterium]
MFKIIGWIHGFSFADCIFDGVNLRNAKRDVKQYKQEQQEEAVKMICPNNFHAAHPEIPWQRRVSFLLGGWRRAQERPKFIALLHCRKGANLGLPVSIGE